MKEIILPLWGAVIASGWWAVGVFGLPKNENDGPAILIFTLGVTILSSLGFLFYAAVKIANDWDKS